MLRVSTVSGCAHIVVATVAMAMCIAHPLPTGAQYLSLIKSLKHLTSVAAQTYVSIPH